MITITFANDVMDFFVKDSGVTRLRASRRSAKGEQFMLTLAIIVCLCRSNTDIRIKTKFLAVALCQS